VDFWWLDWQQWSTTNIPGMSPTMWLNYVHYTDMERQGKVRPLIFHRWGGLGNHRYPIGFSGDVVSVWKSLVFQPYFTATAANVGCAYWSHDIGGHMPGPISAELFTRWLQFGAFSPILRTHTPRTPTPNGASGPTRTTTSSSCARPCCCAIRSSRTSTRRPAKPTRTAWPSCGRCTTTTRKPKRPTPLRTSTCSATT
jgi:alpha-glucosidase (family GH31 glycosyl hydrolase)